jgi:hypothetical protein
MRLNALNRDWNFIEVPLILHQNNMTNLFAQKNNKSVAETLATRTYSKLSGEVKEKYPEFLSYKLGEFLFHLKKQHDLLYLQFLNQYGDETYCKFSISPALTYKGVYSFVVSGNIRYIGRSHDPFAKRINQGYGSISPKNCYKDGQVTNCRLNSFIAQFWTTTQFYICPLEDKNEIDHVEKALIKTLQPEWNVALK